MSPQEIIAEICSQGSVHAEIGERVWGRYPTMSFTANGAPIGKVRCPGGAMPRVYVIRSLVRVVPATGERVGFTLECTTNDEAQMVGGILTNAIAQSNTAGRGASADTGTVRMV